MLLYCVLYQCAAFMCCVLFPFFSLAPCLSVCVCDTVCVCVARLRAPGCYGHQVGILIVACCELCTYLGDQPRDLPIARCARLVGFVLPPSRILLLTILF